MESQRDLILKEVCAVYGTEAEYPFTDDFNTAVLRHSEGRKWYGIIMTVAKSKLGLSSDEKIDILNLKCDPIISGSLIAEKKIFPAYHMNKEKWISVPLDFSLPLGEIMPLVEISYMLTRKKIAKRRKVL